MSQWLQRMAAVVNGEKAEKRRRALKHAGLWCDALEDRQLLSTAAGALGANVPAQFGRAHGMSFGHGHGHGGMRMGQGRGFAPGMAQQNFRLAAAPGNAPTSTAAAQSVAAASTTTAPVAPPVAPNPSAALDPAGFAGQPGAMNSAAQAAFTQLQTDLHDIQAKSDVTQRQRVALADDFKAIAKATTGTPSTDAVTALNNDIKALNGLLPTADQQTQIETDYKALLKSQGVTDDTLIDKTIADLKAVVTSSNVTNDDLTKIIADRKAIAAALTPTTDTTGNTSSSTTAPAPAAPDPLTGLPFDLILGDGHGFGKGPGGPGGGGFGGEGRMGFDHRMGPGRGFGGGSLGSFGQGQNGQSFRGGPMSHFAQGQNNQGFPGGPMGSFGQGGGFGGPRDGWGF
ncbi:MAG: hypothetical protein U0835_09975 [Isosphaeraceae bacterium]